MDKKFLIILLWISLSFLTACSSETRKDLSVSKIDYKRAALLNVDLGRSYLAQGYTERAKRKFIHALKLMPNLPEAHSGMGYFWEAVGEYKEAEYHYRKSISLGDGKGSFYNQYAIFLCERGRYKEADRNFTLAINDKFHEQTAEVYNNAALCVLKYDDKQKAEQYFVKALSHDPRKTELWLELAKIALSRKEFKVAEDYLNQFHKINNNSPTAEYLLLSIKVAKLLKQEDVAASKVLLLKNLFPESVEYNTYQSEYGKK